MTRSKASLARLASLWGVQTAYYDVARNRQTASIPTLLGVLSALGVPLERPEDAEGALIARRLQLAQRVLEPVLVAWDGCLESVPLQLPQSAANGDAHFHLATEFGEDRSWTAKLDRLPVAATELVDATRYVTLGAPGADELLAGYHQLRVEHAGATYQALVISAPRQSYVRHPRGEASPSSGQRGGRSWGLFVPAYAIHSGASWGAGNLSDLERLWDWTVARGGSVVATLPLLAAFLGDPCDPSPYTPASRLLWNEFYLDVERVPELAHSPAAQQLIASDSFQAELRRLRAEPMVQYRDQMRLMRQVLELLAATCRERGGERAADFERFLAEHPHARAYARFRAADEQFGRRWYLWPSPQREGTLTADDYDQRVADYHGYVQWQIQQQLNRLIERAQAAGAGLYLDTPLGVHRDGYDMWSQRDAYALGASGGAPPDAFFTKGQDWGFAPLHPERLRDQQYRHLIEVIQHHARHAGMLRIDHVMQLYRLYWVPHGLGAAEGAYVRYRADELFALVSLESHRHQCEIVGENLGTVPAEVNARLKRHGVSTMYVMQYEMNAGGESPATRVPQRVVASLNTHDMPPLAAFWKEQDIDDLILLDLFDEPTAEEERQRRAAIRQRLTTYLRESGWLTGSDELEQVMPALLRWLSASRAAVLLVTLEDLWLETAPQNVPGTSSERPNWQRKLRFQLETILEDGQLTELLARINSERER